MSSFLRPPLSRAVQFQLKNTRHAQNITFVPPTGSSRSFHATRPRRFDILDPILSTTHGAFLAAHHVLPWWATLPLAALTVRIAFLPLTLRTRRVIRLQRNTYPLLCAWRHAIRRKLRGPTSSQPLAATFASELRQYNNKRKEIYKSFSCQSYKIYIPGLLQFPVFLTIIEVIRGMCGVQVGLLRTLFSSAHVHVPDSITGAAERASAAIVEPGTIVAIIPPEPSMATEGIAWFADLSSADPYLILPFALSATIFLNLLPVHHFSRMPPPPPIKPSAASRGIRNALKLIALAVGPLTLGMPTGMLLYWISSSAITFVQSVLIDRFMPIRDPILQCAPPVSKLIGSLGRAKGDTKVRDAVATKLKE